MATKPQVFRFKIDPELLKKAKKQAKTESRTVASLVRFAIIQYLAGAQS